MKIIGIMGLAGSGKDTLADLLITQLPLAKKFNLADPLKGICREMGWDGNKDEKGRKLLQQVGVLARECIGEDVWLKKARSAADTAHMLGRQFFIVPDIRFHNEKDWILQQGGMLLLIVRPGIQPMGHVSEQLPLEDHSCPFILNDGTLEDLLGKAKQVAEVLTT